MNFNPLIKLLGKELFILFGASAFRKLSSIYIPFGFEGRIWDLIVSVPDHCLSFYFLFVPQGEDLSLFSFVKGKNLFSVSKFACSSKKESEKLKNSHFGQIHVQFVLFTVSYYVSAMNEHSLWIHISQMSHCTALRPFRTAPLQRPQSALQVVQYQAPSPDSILKSSLSPRFEHEVWTIFSHSSHLKSLSDAL